jgi:hypothetical protein
MLHSIQVLALDGEILQDSVFAERWAVRNNAFELRPDLAVIEHANSSLAASSGEGNARTVRAEERGADGAYQWT